MCINILNYKNTRVKCDMLQQSELSFELSAAESATQRQARKTSGNCLTSNDKHSNTDRLLQ